MRATTLAAALAVALAAPDAGADPAFIGLDRGDGTTRAGASLAYVNVDQAGTGAQRVETFGQYIYATGWGGVGGYGAIGVSRLTADAGGGDDNRVTLGNLELGGLCTVSLLPFPLHLRAGYVIQTAGDDIEDNFANTLAGYSRFTDIIQATSDVAWLRASASGTHRDGKGFYRVDLGIDWPAAGDDKDNSHHYIRLNLGAGYDTGDVAVLFELITSGTFADVDEGEPRFQHVASIGGRYMSAGKIRPSLALALPIDDPGGELINWILLLGADYVF